MDILWISYSRTTKVSTLDIRRHQYFRPHNITDRYKINGKHDSKYF